jgi:flagellar hook protein FlgE
MRFDCAGRFSRRDEISNRSGSWSAIFQKIFRRKQMASFFIPLTGLESDSTALNTIANDLANLNTTGFKNQTVNFSDLFYQEIGEANSGDLIQQGSGVSVAAIQSQFTEGDVVPTGNATDLAIEGNGFFVLGQGAGDIYTRDGNFALTADGQLVTQVGQPVMGYPAVGGVVDTNSPLTGITVPVGQVEPAQATSTFGMNVNLDASATIGTTVPGQITLYDSLGQAQLATVSYTKTGTNTWNYSISMPENVTANSSTAAGVTTIDYNFGSSGGTLATVNTGTNLAITGPTGSGTATINVPAVTAGETVAAYATALQGAVTAAGIGATVTATATGQLSIVGANISTSGSVIQDPVATNTTGSLTFNSSGNLVAPAANISGISFGGLADGAANMSLNWNILGSAGAPTISQTSAASGVSSTTQNGFTSGQYQSFSITADGTVEASFSNGQTLAVGQVALANVANPNGLELLGGGDFAATQASGAPATGVSGSAGLGNFVDDNLEESNVNISAEFSALIIAQRGFEANSKAVTTFDTVAQETINMIH